MMKSGHAPITLPTGIGGIKTAISILSSVKMACQKEFKFLVILLSPWQTNSFG